MCTLHFNHAATPFDQENRRIVCALPVIARDGANGISYFAYQDERDQVCVMPDHSSKFSPSSLNNVAVLEDGHGNQLMRKSYARSRSDMHPPNRVGNRSKHIYAKNILTKHQTPMQGVGKRITDVTKGGTEDHVENLLRHSPQSSSSPALIQQPVQKSVRQELLVKVNSHIRLIIITMQIH